ncbi:uncharacterized protein LOC116612438 [Nematostella vectensis]|uniref:uncharacterized protein LOC116612438 n=1 Tax=Nematostella vectensis TaxID=45351 RepID=UPI0020778C58|nr:uncharacterized protein LOC116612438 [Nematostella vectensis]
MESNVKDRWSLAKTKNLCFRCLKQNHRGYECRSNDRCSVEGCKSTHHFHLHFDKEPSETSNEGRSATNAAFGAAGRSSNAPASVLLRTVPVWVSSDGGRRIKVNAFLDDGSDTSYMRSDVAVALGIKAPENNLALSTLTDTKVIVKSKAVSIEVSSVEGGTKRKMTVWTMNELCSGMPIPDWSRHQERWEHLKGLPFHKVPGRKTVDILMGSDHPELALALEERVGEPGEPVARKTPQGWTCIGRVPEYSNRLVREDKETSKVRIVLDSKAKFEGACLNDAMLTGPKLQRDILEVLLRFRETPVALVGDIKEMFPQVVLEEKDRRYHRLLRRDLETDREPDVYEATRLVFGDRASPFLAQFVMQRHAEELRDEYKLAAPVVLERIYMDAILDSEDTVRDAIKAREQLVKLLGRAGFQIRKWCSNRAQVLEGIPIEERASGVNLDECELPSVKTLGVQWDANTDEFSFAVDQDATSFEFTKRDGGAPYVISAKMALQEAWLESLDWDEGFLERLNATLEDASKLAYAAVTYVRFENEDGLVEVSFVAAKAKVAPIRAISIPRLELMAAGLGLKLAECVSRILDIPLSQHTFWSDSMDVIYWIHGQSRRYKPFVANRVSTFHEKTSPQQWRHVPGKENSADGATRGLNIEELNREHRWFRGPDFLEEGESEWPKKRSDSIQQSEEAEIETNKMSAVYSSRQKRIEQLLDPEKYSSWMRLLRVTAYVMRFIAKLKKKRKKNSE